MLVVAPLDRGPVIYFAASVWALIGGMILIGDAALAEAAGKQPDRLRWQRMMDSRRRTADDRGWTTF